MSNIYIQEPPTTGKVILKTSIGDIDIELWTKEAPKACRNFIKLCYDGYYNNTIFHRIVKGFIAQGGDPLGTGLGGNSIYGQPFKDEFHSRLRFCRRGLVAMANAGKNDNGSQFFFTLAATPELKNKHTIFGKVTGETLYNLLKFDECLTDQDERPLYPPKILKTQVLSNPFNDIVPSEAPKETGGNKEEEKEEKGKQKEEKGVKDFKLLSFGEEAEEDEEEFKELNKKFSGKSKSAHDVLDDPKLSSEPALEQDSSSSKKRKDDSASESESQDEGKTEAVLDAEKKEREKISEKVREKLNAKKSKKFKPDEEEKKEVDEEYYLGKDYVDERKRKLEAVKKEIRDFKRGIQKEKAQKNEAKEKEKQIQKEKQDRSESKTKLKEKAKKQREDREKLKSLGESFTQEKLLNFKNKLSTLREICGENSDEPDTKDNKDDKDIKVEDILTRSIHCEDKTPVLAKDANLKDDDWFEIHDPRNPINKRRRGETSKKGEGNRGKNLTTRA